MLELVPSRYHPHTHPPQGLNTRPYNPECPGASQQMPTVEESPHAWPRLLELDGNLNGNLNGKRKKPKPRPTEWQVEPAPVLPVPQVWAPVEPESEAGGAAAGGKEAGAGAGAGAGEGGAGGEGESVTGALYRLLGKPGKHKGRAIVPYEQCFQGF